MTRLAVSAALFLSALTTHAAHAQVEPTDDTVAAANDAGVDPQELAGALDTLRDAGYANLDARKYLIAEGALTAPAPACDWPICGPLGARIFCIEKLESNHGLQMYNRTPVWNGEHAQGWLGFLPSTARVWGVAIGNRASEWSGAARMLASRAGGQFYGVAAGIC